VLLDQFGGAILILRNCDSRRWLERDGRAQGLRTVESRQVRRAYTTHRPARPLSGRNETLDASGQISGNPPFATCPWASAISHINDSARPSASPVIAYGLRNDYLHCFPEASTSFRASSSTSAPRKPRPPTASQSTQQRCSAEGFFQPNRPRPDTGHELLRPPSAFRFRLAVLRLERLVGRVR
jgi:hypothetical protein